MFNTACDIVPRSSVVSLAWVRIRVIFWLKVSAPVTPQATSPAAAARAATPMPRSILLVFDDWSSRSLLAVVAPAIWATNELVFALRLT